MVTIYLDENFAPQIAQAFDFFERKEKVITAKSTSMFFGMGATDQAIINGMNKGTDFLVTKDSDFARLKVLTTLINQQGVGVFHFKPPKGSKYWSQLEFLMKAWPSIRETALRERPPFLYDFRTNGKLNPLLLQ